MPDLALGHLHPMHVKDVSLVGSVLHEALLEEGVNIGLALMGHLVVPGV